MNMDKMTEEEAKEEANRYIEANRYTMERFKEDVRSSPDSLKTGFKELDKYISIYPGLIFIAGDTGHGKTAFMLSMLKNMLEVNKDKSFLFYSYDEPKDQIVMKLILQTSEIDNEINEKGLGITYLNKVIDHMATCYKQSNKISELIQNGQNKVFSWVPERLKIYPRQPNIESLTDHIIKHINNANIPVAAVFIDYMHQLRDWDSPESRKISISLAKTAYNANIPIISGFRINKEVNSFDDINLYNMAEQQDVVDVPSIILGVWNEIPGEINSLRKLLEEIDQLILRAHVGLDTKPAKDKLPSIKKTLEKKIEELKKTREEVHTPFKIKILKNRNGEMGKTISLKINNLLLKINEDIE